MSFSKEQLNELEEQLRDWGSHKPSQCGSSRLGFEELAKLKAERNRQFQKVAMLGTVVGSAIFISFIATLAFKETSSDPEPKIATSINTDMDEKQQSDLPSVPDTQQSIEAIQNVIYTNLENPDRELQQRWVEAKRNAARDQILKKWLAENL